VLPSLFVCHTEMVDNTFLTIGLTSFRAGLRLLRSKTLQGSHRSGATTRLVLFQILYKYIVIYAFSALSVGRAS
jgi:hypothetical protein